MFEFPKKQKLCSETVIKEMFYNGKSFTTSSFRLVWKQDDNEVKVNLKSIIVVPKKRIRLATKRNIIRRRMNEAYRLHKIEFENILKDRKLKLSIAIIYQNVKILPYSSIEDEIKLILERLSKEI
jgi:ribonuclease P protein component|tara:strand:- start:708 stop:1082 length:375 start_codon:yes stop_codon:yes gene_type:complete